MKNNIFFTYIKNEWKRSRLSSNALVVITVVAATLLSICLVMLANLSGSVDHMMETGKSGHFIQMHSGTVDMESIDNFIETHDYIENGEVVEFLNVAGADIVLYDERENGKGISNLDTSVQDNGLVVQNDKFDFLVDLNDEVVYPQKGEIYLPVCMKKDNSAYEGMKVEICRKPFTVKGFIRDSQMNSTLASSKRFLVCSKDYEEVREKGSIEYIIEFRLKDMEDLNLLEQDYIKENMPANGPTVTYALFKLMNSISDGILILVILIASIIVTIIGSLCIRFTLISKLEEELRQIGIMKGIGIDIKSIKKLYLDKYSLVTLLGCLLGLIVSLCTKKLFISNIRLYMGQAATGFSELIFSLIGIAILALCIILYVKRVLKRIDEVSARSAINGQVQISGKQTKPAGFKISKISGAEAALALADIWKRKKLYFTEFFIFVFLMFLMIVPINMYTTLNDRSFVSYMGLGEYDIQIDIQNVDNVEKTAEEIAVWLESNSYIDSSNITFTKYVCRIDEKGQNQILKIDMGDHEVFPVSYIMGSAPKHDGQIALSVNNADDLALSVGDTIILVTDSGEEVFEICGIYSDITNGGKTAKATSENISGRVMRAMIAIKLSEEVDSQEIKEEIKEKFPNVKVSDVDEYIDKTFGDTKQSIKKAGIAAIIAACVVSFMITYLFVHMLLAKDKYEIKTLRNLGFSRKDIRSQYLWRIVIIGVFGILIGSILANTLGELLAGLMLSGLGIKGLQFVVNIFLVDILLPITLLACTLIASTVALKKVD